MTAYSTKASSSSDAVDGFSADLFWGVTPFGQPEASLVVALGRAGAFGVLDVGLAPAVAAEAIARCVAGMGTGASFGVRVGDGGVVRPDELPAQVSTVVVAAGTALSERFLLGWGDRRVIVEVTSLAEGRAAIGKGAHGLIAKGSESGGRVGAIGTFVLFQQLVENLGVPLWCQGGMGLHTAAAAIAGGATGVVFDAQLALVREMHLPTAVRAALASMDGGETAVLGAHRVYVRPGVAAAGIQEDSAPSEVASRLGVDLSSDALPAGQDAAFAQALAKRFHTAGGVVHAVRSAIRSQLRSACEGGLLQSPSAFAEAFGVRYPLAQGPMTRVSDRPEFAAAVADAGGLPFLALALMAPDAAAELLEETRIALAGRSWGVGILGFVPPELRAAQLAAVLEARPTVALIAGGRPSLARPLEDAGIATFLHVPSPGLLELFVKEGARRFVFEGRECGGHVGPRSSFVLWEQQISELVKGKVEGMDVLFAGGIHDARSAAMVAAMAAPLAERGARVGLLMGTAYLFTDEAVVTGAIRPAFQAAAIACEATALLETAPGHTTRCARSAFTGRFEEERRALEAAGVAGPDRWAALEDLNLGRLRVAAKGIRREGDALVEVGEDVQRADGLYMIGEVATLRSAPTTIAALHSEVFDGAAKVLGAAMLPAAPSAGPLDVAVVGIACLFPGAEDVAQYWANILAGTNHVSEVPAERWDPGIYSSAEGIGPGGTVTPSRWGGFLGEAPFDPMRFGIPPSSLGAIEPVQLLSLEVAANALADAGYATREFDRSRTSVVFGVEGASDLSSAYVFRALAPGYLGAIPEALDEHLPSLTEDSFPGVLSNVIAGRIANRLDLGGANYSVDAACAASLAAVHLACQELVSDGCDMVVCGGADLHNGIYDFQLFASVGALSPTGSCKSFDQGADGIALGEGVACVVLKRLADATRDGDRVYAVIKGVGASSDGRSLGLTAPRAEGQRAALERAYQRAGVAPATVGLVEAHGTGTVVGDRTELSTLTEFFAGSGSAPSSVTLGSVKAQIGHTKCAAGMAGLIKAVLALYHGVHPPTAHIARPSSVYDVSTSPFAFSRTARPWAATTRRAGVSAFGFGGSNFHVVLDSSQDAPPAHGLDRWPAELFAFRTEDDRSVGGQFEDLLGRLGDRSGARLRDLAGDVWSRGSGPVRSAIVATSFEDLGSKLASAAAGRPAPGVYLCGDGAGPAGPAGMAFLFPGQGSQRPAMLSDLFVAFPRLRQLLRLGEDYLQIMFPPLTLDPARTEAQRAAVNDTLVAQPALGMAGLATAWLLDELGIVPDAMAGHSYGELVALSAAGVFGAGDLIWLSEQRGQALAGSSADDAGAMVAVAAPAAQVVALIGSWPGLVVANDNSPGQVVLSGRTTDVAEAAERLGEQGLATRMLGVSCGFHSPLMASGATKFGAALEKVEMRSPQMPVWSNFTAAVYPDDPIAIRSNLASQIDNPVRFREQVESMYEAGIGTYVEAGPGQVLTGLVAKILAGRPHRRVCVDAPGTHGVEQLLHALAALGVAGAPLRLGPLFEGRDVVPIGGRQSSSQLWTIDGHIVRGPDGQPVAGGLRPATELGAIRAAGGATQLSSTAIRSTGQATAGPAAQPLVQAPAAQLSSAVATTGVAAAQLSSAGPVSSPGTVPDGDPVVLEYIRGLNQMVSAGHDVMTRYLESRHGPATTAVSLVEPGEARARPAASAELAEEGKEQTAPASPVSVPVSRVGEPEAPLADPDPQPAPMPARSRDELLSTVVALVSERTGYPAEMLGADLDLEADLSIDSIKRIEIVGDLVARVGLSSGGRDGPDDALVEQLTVLKSLSAIVDWIQAQSTGSAQPQGVDLDPRPASVEAPRLRDAAIETNLPRAAPGPPLRAGRFIQRVEPAGNPEGTEAALAGRSYLITDDGAGIAEQLEELLEMRGARVTVGTWAQPCTADHVVHLESLSSCAASPAEVFGHLVPHLVDLRSLMLVTGTGGSFGRHGPTGPAGQIPGGAGLRGMVRSLAREYPELRVRTVDLDPAGDRALAASQLLSELVADDPLGEVGYRCGQRLRMRLVPDPLVQSGRIGIRPREGDVVLVTGGGRGITAAVAVALARQGCHLELVGRTPLAVEPEDAATAACADQASLRRMLAAAGGTLAGAGATLAGAGGRLAGAGGTLAGLGRPADGRSDQPSSVVAWPDASAIEAECSRIMAQRQLAATLAEVAACGGSANYHALDVRDGLALTALVEDVYLRHGRLDGVIHGAGVVEDRLALDKTPESFARVYDTKVQGARALLAALRPRVRYVVLFGSVAGAFGNRGQLDYAAANEALEALAWAHNGLSADRVACIHWGPWGGAGMVSEGLVGEFARRGVGLIDPDEGVACMLAELALGSPSNAAVIVMRAEPDCLEAVGPATAAGHKRQMVSSR